LHSLEGGFYSSKLKSSMCQDTVENFSLGLWPPSNPFLLHDACLRWCLHVPAITMIKSTAIHQSK
jgi:hypothetical protein